MRAPRPGGRRESHRLTPTEPGVTISGHRALVIPVSEPLPVVDRWSEGIRRRRADEGRRRRTSGGGRSSYGSSPRPRFCCVRSCYLPRRASGRRGDRAVRVAAAAAERRIGGLLAPGGCPTSPRPIWPARASHAGLLQCLLRVDEHPAAYVGPRRLAGEQWAGPFVLKGVCRVDDARRAVDAGVIAISCRATAATTSMATPAAIRDADAERRCGGGAGRGRHRRRIRRAPTWSRRSAWAPGRC